MKNNGKDAWLTLSQNAHPPEPLAIKLAVSINPVTKVPGHPHSLSSVVQSTNSQ